MYYFIPSWYGKERQWIVEEPFWFRVFERMSFDDSINHVKMFQQQGEETALLTLCYQPQLRYFLHKHDLLATSYWSIFDDIQNIRREDTRAIDFKQLDWPKGVRFTHTPFMVKAHLGLEHLADIHFAENGNLLGIYFFEDGEEVKQLLFDDRGFLSSIKYLTKGQAYRQDYLNEWGVWQVREHLNRKERCLEIHPHADRAFQKTFYDSWEELIGERLAVFRHKQCDDDATFIVAADSRHNDLICAQFSSYRKIFSLFGERFDVSDQRALERVVEAAQFIVVDSERTELALQQALSQNLFRPKKVTRLSPFDTRLRLGRSSSLKELIIYFLIDGVDEDLYRQTLSILLGLMMENPLIELHLMTYEVHRSWEQMSADIIEQIRHNDAMERFMSPVEHASENHLEEDEEWELTAVRFSALTNEGQVIRALDEVRLVIDLSEKPHLYTQIASISAGVPQINRIQNEYVVHQKNGWILSDIADLKEAIGFYFDGLSHWNRSLVHTVEKMGDYTSGRIVSKWKELLEETE